MGNFWVTHGPSLVLLTIWAKPEGLRGAQLQTPTFYPWRKVQTADPVLSLPVVGTLAVEVNCFGSSL